MTERLRREAIHHCEHLWPLLVEGRTDERRIDEANDYLRDVAAHSRLMHNIVIRMIERATGVRWI